MLSSRINKVIVTTPITLKVVSILLNNTLTTVADTYGTNAVSAICLPSYTFDTLRAVRAESGTEVSLIWALGTDAFAALDTWNRWQELLDYTHLAIIERPGFTLPTTGPVAELLQAHQAPLTALDEQAQGAIVLPQLRLLDISATNIREQVAQNHSAQFLLPQTVWQFILAHGLYREAH